MITHFRSFVTSRAESFCPLSLFLLCLFFLPCSCIPVSFAVSSSISFIPDLPICRLLMLIFRFHPYRSLLLSYIAYIPAYCSDTLSPSILKQPKLFRKLENLLYPYFLILKFRFSFFNVLFKSPILLFFCGFFFRICYVYKDIISVTKFCNMVVFLTITCGCYNKKSFANFLF